MKWVKTSVVFDSGDPDTTASLIADIFYDMGLQGVILESPEPESELDWAEDALPPPQHNAVIGFLPRNAHLEDNRRELKNRLGGLHPHTGWWYRLLYSDIDEQDWAESWKAHFHPIRVTDRIVIKPTWREHVPEPDDIVIELDPGMAFGTGTHPTTSLCIELIERFMQPGQRVLDVGTGSGILLITAAKLGAGHLTGIDCDSVAVDVAGQNLRLNNVPEDHYTLIEGNLIDGVSTPCDLVIANILTKTILWLIPDIRPLIAEGGIFITSGIIASKKIDVTSKLEEYGFQVLDVVEKEDWVAIAATPKH